MPESPLPGRDDPTAIWTGSEMIVWGGSPGLDRPNGPIEGAAFSPSKGTWRTLSNSGLTPRSGASGTWTGDLAIVWGGTSNRSGRLLDDGAAYDPLTDTWTSLPTAPFAGDQAAWDGHGLLIWSVVDDAVVVAQYQPRARTWTTSVAPLTVGHAVDGLLLRGRLVVATSPLGASSTVDVAVFEPRTRGWVMLPESPASALLAPALVGGAEALFLGGSHDAGGLAANAAVDPVTGQWRTLSDPSFSGLGTEPPVWTGRHAIFLGRVIAAYDSEADRWERLVAGVEEKAREQFAMIWTGDQLLIWGGSGTGDGEPPLATGLIVNLELPGTGGQ